MSKLITFFLLALFTVIVGCGGSGGNGGDNLNSTAVAAAIAIDGKSFRPTGKISLEDGSDVPVAVRKYLLTDGGNGNSISVQVPDLATYVLENAVVTITTNESSKTRSTVFSGDMSIVSSLLNASGPFSQELTESYVLNDSGEITYTGFNLESRLSVRDSRGSVGAELSLDSSYDEPVVDFLSRNDLADLVGTTTQVVASGSADLTITVNLDGDSETQRNSTRINGVVVSYTVQEFLDEFVVQGTTYQNVLVVDVVSDQLNIQTNQLELSTSTFYLAQGLGMIRADNLNNFYGESLSWQLIEVNF